MEHIDIKGAHENNLKHVDLKIPKKQLTVFTGVSGSGKSSIVFDTVATEAQRLLTENFSMFVRNFLPKYSQPLADSIDNLPMAIVIDQKKMGGGSSSTVGTITDIYSVLRLLFSRAGKDALPTSNLYSFNDPQGMCLECQGRGVTQAIIWDSFIDMDKTLNEGAVQVPTWGDWQNDMYPASGFFDNDKKIKDFTDEEMDLLLNGTDRKFTVEYRGKEMNSSYAGILVKFKEAYIDRDIKTRPERTQKAVGSYLGTGTCEGCQGARLSQEALKTTLNGHNIAYFCELEMKNLLEELGKIKDKEAAPLVASLQERLQHLVDIGLPYLNLNRETDSLSGGESQRIKMVKNLNSGLVDVMYIFDEPSVGLHPRDVHRLNELLVKLKERGNSVIVVEHDPDVIKIADYIVDVGPHAGSKGGEIVFEGSYEDLLKSDTLTGRHMENPLPLKTDVRKAKGQMLVENAKTNNLKDVTVNFPEGIFTVVTGVAGSGKSSLVHDEFLKQYPDAIVVDQSAVSANRRSCPATYTGIMDDIRKFFAKENGVKPGLFSFNSEGACPDCQGMGVIYTDLGAVEGVKTPCDTCQGKRYNDEVLEYKLNSKNIFDVLSMNVDEALEYFTDKKILKTLQTMHDVGVGYLSLGQPLNTLSGGECQRIKLSTELHKKGSIYVLDEPTTGLHFSDIDLLLEIINKLVDAGNTVITIEHNLDIIRNADWIIDIGPEGGHDGGEVVFEGTPEQMKKAKTITAQYI